MKKTLSFCCKKNMAKVLLKGTLVFVLKIDTLSSPKSSILSSSTNSLPQHNHFMFTFSFKFHVQAWSCASVNVPVIDRLIEIPKGCILKLRTNTTIGIKLFTITPTVFLSHHLYWGSGSDNSSLRGGGNCPTFCTRFSKLHILYSQLTQLSPVLATQNVREHWQMPGSKVTAAENHCSRNTPK